MGRTDDMAPLLDSADAVFAADPARFRKERLESMSGRAQLARRKGDYDTAIRLLQSSLPDADRVYAEDHRELLTRYNNLLVRSEEHTSELQSLMRISYAVFCLKKKKTPPEHQI